MKALMIGIAVACLAAWGSSARAADSEQSHPTKAAPAASATRAQAGAPYVGVVKKVDKDKGTITVELPLAQNARITRDGTRASLDAIHEGDDVRASFDPKSEAITRLDVESKEKMEKEKKK